jgi:hypothetical protein
MFRNTIKTTILLAGLGGPMVAIGSLFGRSGAVIGSASALPSSGSPTGRAMPWPSAPPTPCPPTRPATLSTSP